MDVRGASHQPGYDAGHGLLHVAGTGARQGIGRPNGPVLLWRGPVRDGDGNACRFEATLPGVICDSILNRHPTPAVRLNPEVPAELERIINKALEKDRNLRYQSAAEMRADLQRLKRDADSSRQVPTHRRDAAVAPAATQFAHTTTSSAVVAAAKQHKWGMAGGGNCRLDHSRCSGYRRLFRLSPACGHALPRISRSLRSRIAESPLRRRSRQTGNICSAPWTTMAGRACGCATSRQTATRRSLRPQKLFIRP